MRCPSCLQENPDSVTRCRICGGLLGNVCSRCRSVNPPPFRFCGNCGTPLRDAFLSNDPPDFLEKRTDPSLADFEEKVEVLSLKGPIEGERRQVTILFCDLEESTSLTEYLGDEKIFILMDELFGILTRQVHKFEGRVQEFRGDGIMALFGVPVALESGAQRAISSALAIQKEIGRFSRRIQQERAGPAIRMRIGIHTGPVILGKIGSDLVLESQVIGDSVNLAARIQSLADPGTVYVTEETFKLTQGFFRFEEKGERTIKGKSAPIKVYRVIAPGMLRTRFEVDAEQGLTPFVGRKRELDQLLSGLEQAKAGIPQFFFIVSEPGLGKSRLLYEFRKKASLDEVTFLEGRCLSYGQRLAYDPLISILRANFNLQEGEEDSIIKSKVRNKLEKMGWKEEGFLPFLLDMLSVKDSGLDSLLISPDLKKVKIIEALKWIIQKGSALRPLVIAIEDLHWLDKYSEEVLEILLEDITESKVLAIFTGRTEYSPPWNGKGFIHTLKLHRLSDREIHDLSTHLLGTAAMEKSLEGLLLQKTEGNPFFLEELIRSLRERQLIEKRGSIYGLSRDIREVDIPTTIQEVIQARVDSLPTPAKEVLQTGSVIEREFDFSILEQVADVPREKLLAYLAHIKKTELLFEKGGPTETRYIFKHALIREVIYGSILTDRRKKLHERIGHTLEILYRDRLEEYADLLSYHFIKSGNFLKGAEYSKKAAKKAEKNATPDTAIAHARDRVFCLDKLPPHDHLEQERIEARTKLGLYQVQLNYHVEAKEVIDPIIDLALKKNLRRRLGQIYLILGSYYSYVAEDQSQALRDLNNALSLAEETQAPISYVLGAFHLGMAFGFTCQFQNSLDYYQKSVDFQRLIKNQMGIAAIRGNMAYGASWIWGRCTMGQKFAEEGIRFAEESGDTYSKGIACGGLGYACFARGDLEEAEKQLLRSVEYCEKIRHNGWLGTACIGLGELYSEKQDYHQAKENFEKSYLFFKDRRIMPSFACLAQIGLARARAMNQEMDYSLESLYRLTRENRTRAIEGLIQKWMGEILFHRGEPYWLEAETWILQALETDRKNDTQIFLGRDYLSYADLLLQKGDRQKAIEKLGMALETFQVCEAEGWAEKTRKKMECIR